MGGFQAPMAFFISAYSLADQVLKGLWIKNP
jgi:hypothetical protein